MERPDFFTLKNGEKVKLPFTDKEYNDRVSELRSVMDQNGLDMVILTSMHNVAYYSGFLYCSFGRQYACVVTSKRSVVVSANIDAGEPGRRCYGENLIYTDWERDNYFKAIISLVQKAKRIGIEKDHLTIERYQNLIDCLGNPEIKDIAPFTMAQRMIKSKEEIVLIKWVIERIS